jgi:peptide/nickel transport system substrate-binding protein
MVTSDSALRQDMALMIQEDLKALGIDVQPVVLERNTYSARNRAGKFDAAIGGWRLPTKVDLGGMFASHAVEDVVNYGRYSNPEMDALLEQAAEVASYRDAKPLFDAAQSILHQDQPYTFLYWQERLVGFSSRVRNVQANPQTPLFHLDGWWVPAEMRTR